MRACTWLRTLQRPCMRMPTHARTACARACVCLQAAAPSAILQLQLLPAGTLTMIYPPGAGEGALGLNVLQHPYR